MSALAVTPTVGAEAVYAFMLGTPRFYTRADFKAGFRHALDIEIERLIELADRIDGDADLEPSLGTATGGFLDLCRCTDDREAEPEHDEEDGSREPSLAHPERHPSVPWCFYDGVRRSRDGRQRNVGLGCRDEREDEHDGRESDESGYGDYDGLTVEETGEPLLGWNDAGDFGDVWSASVGENEDDLGATIEQGEHQLDWGVGQFGRCGANA